MPPTPNPHLLFAGIVSVYDRHGEKVDDIPLPGKGAILSLEWDKDGECLAILQVSVSNPLVDF